MAKAVQPSLAALMVGIRHYGKGPMRPLRPWTAIELMHMRDALDRNLQYHG